MKRKLNDEVYFRVISTQEQLKNAKIGGITRYDVNLLDAITKDQIEIVTDSNNKVLSALEVCEYIFKRAKDIEVFRNWHSDFFNIFEIDYKKS